MKYLPYVVVLVLLVALPFAFAGRVAEKLPPGKIELQSQDPYSEWIVDASGTTLFWISTAGDVYIKGFLDVDGSVYLPGGVTVYNGSIPSTQILPGSGVSSIAVYVLGNLVPTGSQVTSWIQSGVSNMYDDSMVDAYHRHSELSASDGSPNPAVWVIANGNVGIGVSTPTRKLHVLDTIQISDDASGHTITDGGFIANGSSGLFYIRNQENDGNMTFYLKHETLPVATMTLTTNGVMVGGDSGVSLPGGGTTAFLLMANSAVTPGAITGGAGIFAYNDELYAMDKVGNVTRLSAHDRETGESVHYSFNIYTGVGKNIWLERGNAVSTFTVPKTNPEIIATDLKRKELVTEVLTDSKSGATRYRTVQEVTSNINAYKFDWKTLPPYVRQAWGK